MTPIQNDSPNPPNSKKKKKSENANSNIFYDISFDIVGEAAFELIGEFIGGIFRVLTIFED